MHLTIKRYIDTIDKWVTPFLAFLVLLSSVFVSYDFEMIKKMHPHWDRLFDILHAYLPIMFIGFAGLTFVLSLLHLIFCQPTIKTLMKELRDERTKNELIGDNIKNLFDGNLYQLSKKLNFGERETNCERVTIYIYGEDNHFIPFGRFSANPAYRSPGRAQYSVDQGCISRGWQDGWHFDNDMGDGENYRKNNRTKYNIKKDTSDKIRMKSRLYAVKRIDSDNGNQLAVLVVESLSQDRFNEQELKNKLDQEEGYFAELITKLKSHIPSLDNARQRGL